MLPSAELRLVTGAVQRLVRIVIAHEVRAMRAHIADADGLISAELSLHLKVPFGDLGGDSSGKAGRQRSLPSARTSSNQ